MRARGTSAPLFALRSLLAMFVCAYGGLLMLVGKSGSPAHESDDAVVEIAVLVRRHQTLPILRGDTATCNLYAFFSGCCVGIMYAVLFLRSQ